MLSCRKLEADMQAHKNWTGLRAAGRSFGAGQGRVLKDAAMGYISVQTVCLCCRLISIEHGLSFTCFRWVLKGLLVFGAAERITLPLELFAMTIRLV